MIYGNVPAGSVAFSVTSSNPALIPNTSGNIILIGSLGNQSVVLVPVPGATGSSTITLTLDDTVNPLVTKTFTATVNTKDQVPVVGMPVALHFDGSNNLVRVPWFRHQRAFK